MRLIGLNGFKTSGKDTTCDIIKQIEYARWTGHKVQRAGFADKLKIMAALAVGYDYQDGDLIEIMNDCKEFFDFTIHDKRQAEAGNRPEAQFRGREYLQWFGGSARTVFGDTFWIDQVLPPFPQPGNKALHRMELEAKYPDVDVLVITDVRYANEAQRVKDLGGQVWEILRPGLDSDGHASEVPLPRELVDTVITNDGTVKDLMNKIREVL